MNRLTAFFLILLRLVIGWHFLFEGLQKIESVAAGPTTTSQPFSSAGYFREAPGPMGTLYRNHFGDPDEELLARLIVTPLHEGKPPESSPLHERMPPGLHEDYQRHLVRFMAHYELEEHQREPAKAKLQQAEDSVVLWLTYVAPDDPKKRDKLYDSMTTEQTRKFATGEVKRRMTMAERVAEYQAKVSEYQDTKDRKLWLLGRDVEGAKLRQAKADVIALRKGLQKDLEQKAAEYHKALATVLTKEQQSLGTPPEPEEDRTQFWLDWLTRWGLTAIGVCLLVGFFSRTSSFLGGMFLLTTYLTWPSFPWLPGPPASEGNYLFVNKNLVEMFALFVLMTTNSGRWFGVDAVVHRLWQLVSGERDPAPQNAKR